MRAALIAVLALGLAACAIVDEQVAIATASGCIRSECKDPDATDYTRCEAACRARYGR